MKERRRSDEEVDLIVRAITALNGVFNADKQSAVVALVTYIEFLKIEYRELDWETLEAEGRKAALDFIKKGVFKRGE